MKNNNITGIESIDPNFRQTQTAEKMGTVWYNPMGKPFRLAGFYWMEQDRVYRRMPLKTDEPLPGGVETLSWHTSGGIVKFRTAGTELLVRGVTRGAGPMRHMPRTGQSGIDLYIGAPGQEKACGAKALLEGETAFEYQWPLGPDMRMREVTLNLPLYDGLESLEIGLPSGAKLEPPTPYVNNDKIVIYGSSTIQGACVTRPGNALSNRLSRALNMEVINLGFSGSGLSEEIVAKCIASMRGLALLVYNPDSNAKMEWLPQRFPRLIEIFREQHPEVPILVATRHILAPEAHEFAEGRSGNLQRIEREEYIAQAVAEMQTKDQNLHFLSGTELLGENFDDYTVDGSHLGDIGFLRMSEVQEKHIRRLLK